MILLHESLQEADFSAHAACTRSKGPVTNDWLLQLYAWQGRHHTAHVNGVRNQGIR